VVVLRLIRMYSYYLLSIFKLFVGFHNPILLAKIFLNPRNARVKTVRLRASGLQFRVRGAMDVWSIKETFLDRFYEKYGFTIQPGWKILDIGAGIGDYTLYAAMRPESQIFSFEPYPQSFALMQDNLRLNRVPNAQAFDQAIGAVSGKLVLDLTGGEPLQFQSSMTQAAHIEKGLSVNALSLADAFAMLEMDSCDLLKLDCEGAEYAILFDTPRPVLERVQRIVMEYHDNVVPYTHRDLSRFLNEQGFEVETFRNPVHSYLGYLRAVQKN
jgi:FkbM family methyltransferase